MSIAAGQPAPEPPAPEPPASAPLASEPLAPRHLEDCLALDATALGGLWSREQWRRELEEDGRPGVGLWQQGQLVAMACGWLILEELHITLVAVDPDFLYGDASVAYAKVLADRQEGEKAIVHLNQHFKRWSHPEAYLVLAQVHQQQGDREAAKTAIETMIMKVKSSPPYHYRKNQRYVKQGEKLLRSL